MSDKARVMIIDDDSGILAAVRRALARSRTPLVIEPFSDPDLALQRAEDVEFDVVISDYRMPAMDGMEFLSQMRALQPQCARMVLSGGADAAALVEAINRCGIVRFLAKPWDDNELVLAVESALTERNLRLENQRLADQLRVQQGALSQQEAELRRLEADTPGITRLCWNEEGRIVFPDPSGGE